MRLLAQLGLGVAAFAAGAAITTVAYVVVIGHLIWEGELD